MVKNQRMNWWHNPEWLMVWITAALAVFAALSAYFVYDQLQDAHDSFRVDQRAWVGFDRIGINRSEDEKGIKFALTLIIKNTGKTPALNVSIDNLTTGRPRDADPPTWEEEDKQKAEIENKAHEAEQKYGMKNLTLPERHDVLAPGAQQEISTATMLYTPESLKPLETTNRYFLVRVLYNDVFDPKVRHKTTLCFMYHRLEEVQTCNTGNTMD